MAAMAMFQESWSASIPCIVLTSPKRRDFAFELPYTSTHQEDVTAQWISNALLDHELAIERAKAACCLGLWLHHSYIGIEDFETSSFSRTYSSGRFRNNSSKPQSPTITSSPSSSSISSRMPTSPSTQSFTESQGAASQGQVGQNGDIFSIYNLPRVKPLWLNNAYAKQIVKGNFMTLSAKPKTMEMGEWIAHQCSEHYRNLWNFVTLIHDKEDGGDSICNHVTCPRMSAGPNHSFTWLNSQREPVEVPAHEYISLMRRWITGKIENSETFPTDPSTVSFAQAIAPATAAQATFPSGGLDSPGAAQIPILAGPTTIQAPLSQLAGPQDWIGKSSGFPQDFFAVCQTIFRQMFRVYAHLYWAHFVNPFYHMSLSNHLNSCFSHFVLTATTLDLLKPHELEPMQPLIDLWAANGTFPPESKAYQMANLAVGQKLLALSEAAQTGN